MSLARSSILGIGSRCHGGKGQEFWKFPMEAKDDPASDPQRGVILFVFYEVLASIDALLCGVELCRM